MIKGLFNLVFGLIRFAFLLVVLTLIFHTWMIKQAVKLSLGMSLGADVSVQEVKMDWKNTGFEARGLEVGNPYDFPKGRLADIPLAIVSVDIPSISKGIWHLKTVALDLRELQVMNVPNKGLNILALKSLSKSETQGSASPSQEAFRRQVKKFIPKVVIDELIFSFGEIAYLDMSGPSLRQSRFPVGIRGATYYNVGGSEDVALIIVNEALKKLGFNYLDTQFKKVMGYGMKEEGFLSRALKAIKGE